MKIGKSIALILVMVLSFSYLSVQQTKIVKAEEKSPLKIEKIIGLSKEPGTFRIANGLAVAKDGTIFIGDTGESQIEVFDSNLKYLRSFGSIGSGDGQFQEIEKIRFDENENLYVLDSFLCRIQVFNKEGKLLKKIGEKGTKPNQLDAPNDFIFLNKNEILIVDAAFNFDDEKNNVKVFSKDGSYVRDFFKNKKYVSKDLYYDSVAVDQKGFVYIDSFDLDSIDFGFFKFSQDGNFVCDYIADGEQEKDITNYLGYKSIDGNYLYLTDWNAIKKYEIVDDSKMPLQFVGTIKKESDEVLDETSILNPSDLLHFQQKIYFLDCYRNRLTVYNDKMEVLGSLQSSIMEDGEMYANNETPKEILSSPYGITIGPDNNFYVANCRYNKVSIFDANWKEIKSIGIPIEGKEKVLGEIGNPFDIVFDQQGYCYVSDRGGYISDRGSCSIEVYTKDLVPFMSINIERGLEPQGIAINSLGFLVVCLSGYPKNSIGIFDISKIAEKKISQVKTFTLDSEGYDIVDVVIDDQDKMIVSLEDSNEIVWLSTDGEVIQKFVDKSTPCGLLRDGAGNIYVAKPDNQSIQKLSPKGEIIWEADLGWYSLSYMTMDSQGKLYVTDDCHNVILVLSDSTAVPPVPKEPTLDESEAEFSFSVDKTDIAEQDTFTLSVNVENLDKTSSIDMTLQYPDSLLQVDSCGLGDLLKSQSFDSPSTLKKPGTIQIKSSSKNRGLVSGSGVLFNLKLKATKSGLVYFDFGDITLLNSKGEKVSYAGKRSLTIVIKSRVASPPPLTLKQVPKVVYDPDLRIEGVTNPGITVTINKKEVSVKEDGSFQTVVALTKGVNTIRVEATNQLGDKSTETILVTRKERIMITLTIGSKVMVVNAQPEPLDAPPYIDKKSGRTMVPVRAITQTIGATISFDAKEQKITISVEDTLVTLWIGKPIALINGAEVPIDSGGKVIPVIVGGRTFVPLRFVAESFNFQVDWDAKTQGITLTYPK